MRSPFAPLLLAAGLLSSACVDDSPPASTRSAGVGLSGAEARVAPGPQDVAHAFLTAVEAEDERETKRHLSDAARELYGTDGGFSTTGHAADSFTVGAAAIDGTQARVPTTVTTGDAQQSFEILLRREHGEWRVHGIDLPLGDTSWTVSFEGQEDATSVLLEQVAEGIGEAFGEAFEGAMSDWAAGGSKEEIELERARYEALDSVPSDSIDEEWLEDVEARGRSAREVLLGALEGTGYELRAGDHERALARGIDLSLERVSRVRIVEETAALVGLVPVWSDPQPGWGGAEHGNVSFAEGPRRTPVAFSGPFLVEVALEENAPNTTGALTVTARALGLPEAVRGCNAEMRETLRVARVEGPGAASLIGEEGMQYWTAPTLVGSSLISSLTVELRGLLRSVERLDVSGEVLLDLPQLVGEASFRAPGEKRAGVWSVTCKSIGENSEFEIRADGRAELEHVSARFAPDDPQGDALGILSQGVFAWGDRATANMQTPAAPESIGVKVLENAPLTFAFRIAETPLERFREQPERLELLRFAGSAPIVVDFLGWGDRSNADFPEVTLRVVSSANKVALDVQATFEYLDARGTVAHEFPHTLSGEFTFDGPQPLVGAQGTAERTVTAFFQPEGTTALRVRVEEVSFADGTTWKRE